MCQGRNNYYDRGRQIDKNRSSSGDRFRGLPYKGRPKMHKISKGEMLGKEMFEEVVILE